MFQFLIGRLATRRPVEVGEGVDVFQFLIGRLATEWGEKGSR